MTTTEQVALCNPCDFPACMYPRSHDVHVVEYRFGTNVLNHEFVEHTHTKPCDAAFWRLMGCSVGLENGIPICWAAAHAHHGKLAPILSAPEAEASRLAMFDVMAWAHERDWIVWMDVRSKGPTWLVGVYPLHGTRRVAETVDTLPRAVAEAVQQAIGGDS